MSEEKRPTSRRKFLLGLIAGLAVFAALGAKLRRSLRARLARLTEDRAFSSTPPLLPHDPKTDQTMIYVAKGEDPGANIDTVLQKIGGIDKVVGKNDVVIVKVSAQWWNQGMTNVAATKRLIEQVLERDGFAGEVVVFENTHFRMADGSGLSRAWTRPSERNVDVPGWDKLGDLIPHFQAKQAPVSFVGLIDGGPNRLAPDDWHDAGHAHGVYGGDGRGPIQPGEVREGYYWDFTKTFEKRRGWLETMRTPLTWPVFSSPKSGLLIDLKDGVFRVENGARVPAGRKLTWINLSTLNEHSAGGITGCCKSSMGIFDMSAGMIGTDARVRDYRSVHYFGHPGSMWRMAGPLAHFAKQVRMPDLYIAVAHWVAVTPRGMDPDKDSRLEAVAAHPARTVVAGTDPVAIDYWCAKNLLLPIQGPNRALYDVTDLNSSATRFLRYYREVLGRGTLDEKLIRVV